MDYPILDAATTELLLVAHEACATAWPRIDDLETAKEVEQMIVTLDRILGIAGNA